MKLMAALFAIGTIFLSAPGEAKDCPKCTHKEATDPAASIKNKHKDLREFLLYLPPYQSGPTTGYFDNCFAKDHQKARRHANARAVFMSGNDHKDSIQFLNDTGALYRVTFSPWPFEEDTATREIVVKANDCSNVYHLSSAWASSDSAPESEIHTFAWSHGHWVPLKRSGKKPQNPGGIRQVGPVVAGDD